MPQNTDEFRQRLLVTAERLKHQGVKEYDFAPPLYRLMWRLGLRVRPPLYQSFWTLALLQGIWFSTTWGIAMWVVARAAIHFVSPLRASPHVTDGSVARFMLGMALLAGTWFGLEIAVRIRRRARGLQLPPLDDTTAA